MALVLEARVPGVAWALRLLGLAVHAFDPRVEVGLRVSRGRAAREGGSPRVVSGAQN